MLGDKECKVEDREWSVAVVAAAANANPQLADSVILDKMPGGRLMREYKSIVVASDSGNDNDDRMLINYDFDGGEDFDGGGGGSNKGEYGCIPRAANALSGVLANIANINDDDNDNNNDDAKDGESCDFDGGNRMMSSPSCLDDELSLRTCLNSDELNVFYVDGILVESIASMLVVDDADDGGKDEKDNDNNNADNNDDECLSLSTTVDGATCDVRHVKSG